MGEKSPQNETAPALRALVALLAADRDERVSGQPTQRSELVLADAGLSVQEIANLTGKNYRTVQSAVRRKGGNGRA